MQHVFQCTDGIGLTIVEHDAECIDGTSLVNVGFGLAGTVAAQEYDFRALGPAGFRAFFYAPAIVNTQSEIDLTVAKTKSNSRRALVADTSPPAGIESNDHGRARPLIDTRW